MKTNWKLTILAAVLFVAAAACTVDLGVWKFWDQETDTEEPSLATFTPIIPTLTPLPEVTEATPTEEVVVPTVTPAQAPTSSTPSTNAVGAACLPGVWQINYESVINYIYLTMIGVNQYGFSPQGASGKLELHVAESQIALYADDFTVDVGVHVGEMTNLSAFSAAINAEGGAYYTATDSQVYLSGIVYDAEGTVTSLSASLTADFDDLFSLAQSLGFGEDIPASITYRTLNYSCGGDVLSIQVNPYASVIFDRVVSE